MEWLENLRFHQPLKMLIRHNSFDPPTLSLTNFQCSQLWVIIVHLMDCGGNFHVSWQLAQGKCPQFNLLQLKQCAKFHQCQLLAITECPRSGHLLVDRLGDIQPKNVRNSSASAPMKRVTSSNWCQQQSNASNIST